MKQFSALRLNKGLVLLFTIIFHFVQFNSSFAQQTSTKISDYVVYGGWNSSAGSTAVDLGSSSIISGGGLVGSKQSLKTTGSLNLTGSIFSAGKIVLSNNNTISGRVTAASGTGTILQAGTGTKITGNLDVKGNISIGTSGSILSGKVTQSTGSSYSGPNPAGGKFIGTPDLPIQPVMPAITNFTNFPFGTTDIKNTRTITPGKYKELELNGGKVITFSGTGIYVFKEIELEGNDNTLKFDFKGDQTGKIIIYVHEDVELFKLKVEILGGGNASRIFTEIHGNGSSCSDNTSAFRHVNTTSGSNNGQWRGTVFAPYGNIVLGFNSQNSDYQGALWSGKQVIFQSNVKLVYVPLASDVPQVIIPQYPFPENGKTTAEQVGWELGSICSNAALLTRLQNLSFTDPLRDIYFVEGSFLNIEVQTIVSGTNLTNAQIDAQVKAIEDLLTSAYGMIDIYPRKSGSLVIQGKFPLATLCILETAAIFDNKIKDVVPMSPSVSNFGSTSTVGDVFQGSDKLRNGYGLKGEGVKIGVISDSYAKRPVSLGGTTATQDIDRLDLPGKSTNPENTKPVEVVNGKDYPAAATDEGRAMLQIVHDIAPKAELFFRTGSISANDMALGIQELADRGCNIIVDDLTFFREPFFKDGIISKAIDNVKVAGVSYFTSAGNFSNKGYGSTFVGLPAPVNTPVNPGKTALAHSFGSNDIFQKIQLQKGDYTIVLQWDNDFYSLGETDALGNIKGAKDDLDIYLIDDNGNILFGFNKNNIGKDPVEVLPFSVTENNALSNIMIVSASGAPISGLRFRYIVFRGKNDLTILENNIGTPTIIGHANAKGAMTVGAIRYTTATASPFIEEFTSLGGTPISLSQGGTENRFKPDFAAPNGGNNTVLGQDIDTDGFPNFFGSSASAPHAAAAAALLMEARFKFYRNDPLVPLPTGDALSTKFTSFLKSSFSPDDVKALLTSKALDLSSPTKAGKGAIRVDEAIKDLGNARPIITDVDINNVNGQVQVTVTGEYLDPNSIIVIGGVGQTATDVVGSTATTTIGSLVGNPTFQLSSPPKTDANGNVITNGQDGGLSNPVFLDDARPTVSIKVLDATKKFGEIFEQVVGKDSDGKPIRKSIFQAEITVSRNITQNGVVSTQTSVYNYPADTVTNPGLLASLGITNLSLSTNANNLSPISSDTRSYAVSATPTYNQATKDDFIYFPPKDGKMIITPMPIRISAYQKKNETNPLRYGQPIRDIGFIYFLDESNLGDETELGERQIKEFRIAVMIKHQRGIYQNKYAIISDRALAKKPGSGIDVGLDLKDLENLTALANEDVILNGEDVILNGEDVILNGEDVILNGEDVILNGEDVIVNEQVINPKETFSSINKDSTTYLTNISLSSFFKFLPTNDNDNVAVNIEDVILNNEDVILNGEDVILNTEDVILNNEDVILNTEDVILNSEDVILNGEDIILNGVFLNTEDVILNNEDVILNNDGLVSIEDVILNGEDVILNTEDVILNTEDVILNTEDIILNGEDVILNTSSILSAVNNMGAGGFNDNTVINGVSNDKVMVLFNATTKNGVSTFSNNVSPITVLTGVEAGRHYIIPAAFFNENFLVTYEPGELKILPAVLNVAANVAAETAIYGTTLTGLDVDVKVNSNWYKKDKPSDVIESIGAKLEKKDGNNYTTVEKTVTIPGVGEYRIKPVLKLKEIKNAAGTITYEPNYILSEEIINDNIIISPKAITITADNKEKVYDKVTTTPALTYTVPDGAVITGDAFSGSLSRIANENVGNYVGAITQGDLSLGTNYTLTVTPGTLKINPKAINVTADNKEKVYDKVTTTPALTYTVPDGAVITGDAFSGSLSRVANENVGNYVDAITQGDLTLGTNYTLTVTPGTLKINPKVITITADNKEKVYDKVTTIPALTYTVPDGAVITGDAFSGSLSRVANENVGTYVDAITQGDLSLGANYTLSVTPGTLKINPKAITVIADNKEKIYDKVTTTPALTYTVPDGAVIAGDLFSGSLSRVANENVGTYPIDKGSLTLGDNYTLLVTPGTLKINPKAITVTADNKEKVYDKVTTIPALTYTVPDGAVIAGDAFSGSLSRAANENVGTYVGAIIKGGLTLGANYTLTVTPGTLKINPKVIAVTAEAKTKVYDGDATKPALTYTVPAGAVITGDAFSGSLSRVAGENVGTYAINQGSLTLGNNYSLSFTGNNLTITKAGAITVKADDKYIYTGNPQPVYTSTYTGFIGSDQASITSGPTYNLDRIWDGTLGNYIIRPSNLVFSKSQNYSSVTYQTGTLYVTPAKGYNTITIKSICIIDRGSAGADGFRYVARFTYNSNNWPNFVYIPLGSDNNLVSDGGAAAFKGVPPVLFKPGDNVVEIPFNGQKLTWTIKSTQSNGTKVTRTGFATTSTTRCTSGGSVAYGGMQLDELSGMTDGPVDSKYSTYPNPVSNRLTVTSAMQSLKANDISIFDLQGKQYRVNSTRQINTNKVELDLSNIAAGVYIVRINTGAENKIFRIVKQ